MTILDDSWVDEVGDQRYNVGLGSGIDLILLDTCAASLTFMKQSGTMVKYYIQPCITFIIIERSLMV